MAVASTCVGTPLYLAPELCEGKLYNHSCDVWSLGVILYEMLALAPPFIAQAMPALVMKICGAEPPPLPAACSPPVRELAARLLPRHHLGGVARRFSLQLAEDAVQELAHLLAAKACLPIGD